MFNENAFFQDGDDFKPVNTTPIVQKMNSDDEEEKLSHPKALIEQINLNDDTTPLQKQTTPRDLQNTAQVQIAQRKQQLPQNQGQAGDKDSVQNKPEQQKQSQPQVKAQPLQLQLQGESPPKPQSQKARCPKLCQVPVRILEINLNSIDDKRAFFMSPCPPGVKMQCCFKIYRGCFSHRYECYLNENQYMMSATRESFNIAKNFSISFNPNYKKKDPSSYLGKITANPIGTEFEIFGQEENASSLKNLGAVIHPEKIELRKFKAYIPEVDETTAKSHTFSTGKESILNKWKNGDRSNIYDWHNKEPKWIAQLQAYVLNFNGRANQASVKNFLMIDEFDDERIFLLFGRMNRDTFNMDFEWPLSPFQAFAICVTHFAYKIIPE